MRNFILFDIFQDIVIAECTIYWKLQCEFFKYKPSPTDFEYGFKYNPRPAFFSIARLCHAFSSNICLLFFTSFNVFAIFVTVPTTVPIPAKIGKSGKIPPLMRGVLMILDFLFVLFFPGFFSGSKRGFEFC